MSAGTFTPAPGAAPLGRQVLSHARMEARLMLRNGEQLLLAVVIPVIVLVGAVAGSERVGLELDAPAIDTFAPGVPLLLVEALQVVVLGAVALALGWQPETTAVGLLSALGVAAVGTAAFAALGLFVAGVLRAEATLAAANLVYLLLMAGGAVVLPANAYGGFGDVATWLPSGALGEGMRAALLDGAADVTSMLTLLGWAALGTVLTARTFTWE